MVMFDTLKASRRLRDAGFEEEKADALVDAFAEDIGANLATKNDLANGLTSLEQRLSLRIALAIGGATTVLLAAIGIVAGIIVSRL